MFADFLKGYSASYQIHPWDIVCIEILVRMPFLIMRFLIMRFLFDIILKLRNYEKTVFKRIIYFLI